MGQRLNLEIVNNAGVLANSYYHWSAYTGSAIELTEIALRAFYEAPEDLSSLGLAVFMLQETGAGVYKEENDRIAKDKDKWNLGIQFQDAIDRNRGLLSVTKHGIEETERWEEERVVVNIESERIDFGVLFEYSSDEYNDDYGEDAFDQLIECDTSFDDIPFDDFSGIRDIYEIHPDGFKTTGGDAVIWIS